jgi:hypothetical protein
MSNSEGVKERPVVPRKYAGKWIAWSSDGMRILASGNTLDEVQRAAKIAQEQDVGYEWIPPASARIVGAGR